MIVSCGHSASGFDQSTMSAQASASSGRIAATAPLSHGCGSSAVILMVRSVSRFSVVACSARLPIHANSIAAKTQPHSVSERRPIGVPGGTGPSGAILRGVAPGIWIGRDKRAHGLAIAEVDPLHRDDFVDDRRQLAPGLRTLDLRLPC